jgi:hypothetical protein
LLLLLVIIAIIIAIIIIIIFQVTTDPHTGQEKKKHKLGGAYPGNRKKPQAPYTPGASQFNSQGQATAHFVSYGGGNALVLQQGGMAQPQVGEKPQFIQGKEMDGWMGRYCFVVCCSYIQILNTVGMNNQVTESRVC